MRTAATQHIQKKSIFVHTRPFFGDNRLEGIRRRRKWVNFAKTKRARWEPMKRSAVCSKHFKADDYIFQYTFPPELSRTLTIPRLQRDEVGILVFTTIHSSKTSSKSASKQANCEKGVKFLIAHSLFSLE